MFFLLKNVLLVFDFLQGGINLRNIIIHLNNKATLIAIILNNFQAFWRGWLNPRVHWTTLDNTGVHRSTLEYTGVHWSTLEYTGGHWSTLEYTGVHWSTLTKVH